VVLDIKNKDKTAGLIYNVFGKQVATASMWPPQKLTNKPKNRSLIFQQRLNNKL